MGTCAAQGKHSYRWHLALSVLDVTLPRTVWPTAWSVPLVSHRSLCPNSSSTRVLQIVSRNNKWSRTYQSEKAKSWLVLVLAESRPRSSTEMPNVIRGSVFPSKSGPAAAETPNRHETTADHERLVRLSSMQAAEAVLGGRFHSVREARNTFPKASPELANTMLRDMRASPAAALMAEQAQQAELNRQEAAVATYSTEYDAALRSDMVWINDRFEELLSRADSSVIDMVEQEQNKWSWCFEEAEERDRRFFSHAFMYSVSSSRLSTRRCPITVRNPGSNSAVSIPLAADNPLCAPRRVSLGRERTSHP